MKNIPNTPKGVSLIIHTKQEEKNIKDCILSVKSFADEVIVIDMSSTDKTVEIAQRLGAFIFSIPDKGFVDNFRNFGISKANFEWIFSLDADERLTKKLIKTLKRVMKEDKYDVVRLPFKNIRLGKWMEYTGFWPDYHPRFFRKGFVKWKQNIKQAHVPLIINGRVLTLEPKEKNAIIHYNVDSINHFLIKFMRYAALKNGDDFFKKNKLTVHDLINYYEGEFRWRYIEKKGYLDGMRGFVFAKFREFSKFMEFVNFWESEHYPEIFKQEDLLAVVSNKNLPNISRNFENSKVFKLWRLYHKVKDKFFLMV